MVTIYRFLIYLYSLSLIAVVGLFPILVSSMVFAFVQGTILFILYPYINTLFLTAAENGIIAYQLGWWNSICIMWLFNLLFKSNTTHTHTHNSPIKDV